MSKFWSKLIKELSPYIPGEQPKNQALIKLNTNENPYGPSPKVLAAIKSVISDELKLLVHPIFLLGMVPMRFWHLYFKGI